jgi:hypothetical protein
MKPHTCRGLDTPPPLHTSSSLRRSCAPAVNSLRHVVYRRIPAGKRCHFILSASAKQSPRVAHSRRHVLLAPVLTIGAWVLRSALANAEDKTTGSGAPEKSHAPPAPTGEEKKEEPIVSRIYDSTGIGEPMAVGKDKIKVWEKLMNARIVYLGEAEHVPIRDDKELELEIVRNLRKRCAESDRTISLALEAFPCDMQEQLNQYMNKRFWSDRIPYLHIYIHL